MTRMTSLACLLTLGLSPALLACADDGGGADEVAPDTGDGDTTSDDTTTTGDGDTTTTTDGGTDTTTTTDGGTDTTTTTDGGTETTTDESGGTDTGAMDTGTDTGGMPDNSTYSAVVMPGGLDRVTITRVNLDEPSCSEMVLYGPVMFDMFDIDIPDPWRVELMRSWDAAECPVDKNNPDSTAEGGLGFVEFNGFDALMTYPCATSFDVEFDLDTDPPSTMTWQADNVVIEGVNCG